MNRRATGMLVGLIVCGVTASVGLMVWAGPKTGSKKRKVAAFKPVLDVHQQMECQGGLYKSLKDGLLDKKWGPAADSAWLLAELGNINQYQHEDAEYQKFAKAMSDDCVTLAKALKKHDEAAAKDALKLVGQRCADCHDAYKK